MPEFKEGELPEKEFFFGILGTIHSEWLTKEISASMDRRHTKVQEE